MQITVFATLSAIYLGMWNIQQTPKYFAEPTPQERKLGRQAFSLLPCCSLTRGNCTLALCGKGERRSKGKMKH